MNKTAEDKIKFSEEIIDAKKIYEYAAGPEADILLIQMVDDHDLDVLKNEISYIRELTGGKDFRLKAVKVNSWNDDLSPWPAPAVFGNDDFGNGAAGTLNYLLENIIPAQENIHIQEIASKSIPIHGITAKNDQTNIIRKVYIGGYSLAGLFALWAGYQTDRFDGIAAASPSVWFPHFTDYMQENAIHADAVYLSLGDREERTRNPVMSRVADAIRKADSLLTDSGTDCVLEWNKGNHFKEPDLRTAKAFAWLMNRETGK